MLSSGQAEERGRTSAMSSSGQAGSADWSARFPILDTKADYDEWSTKAHLVIKCMGGKTLIGDTPEAVPSMSMEMSALDDRIHARLCLSIGSTLFSVIRSTKTTHEAWYALKAMFGTGGIQEAIRAVRSLFTIKQGNQSIALYIAQVEKAVYVVNALPSKVLEVKDNLKAMILLMGLNENYESVIDAINASMEESSLKSAAVEKILVNKQTQLSERGHQDDGGSAGSVVMALKAEIASLKSCRYCAKSPCWRDTCWRLHPERRPVHQRHHKPSTGDKTPSVRVYSASSEASSSCGSCWLVDCGCNHHISNDDALLSDVQPYRIGVSLGDDSVVASGVGIGNASIMLGETAGRMEQVLHVPSMGKNLLSVGMSTKKGLSFWFHDDRLLVFQSVVAPPSGELLVDIPRSNGLYSLPCDGCRYKPSQVANDVSLDQSLSLHNSVSVNFAQRQVSASCDIWHQRLGHCSARNVRALCKKSNGIRIVKETQSCDSRSTLCEACVRAKLIRGPYPSRDPSSRRSRALQLVFSDVMGPFPAAIFSGAKYIVTFIDDCTRFCHVFFITSKADVFEKVKEFVKMTTRYKDSRLEQLITFQSDNGGEYTSNQMKEYFRDEGICHRTTVRYTPEHNGVAERLNRTLMESAEANRIHAGLDQRFWADAMATAVHLYNRRVHNTIGKTPYQAWNGIKPSLSHLRVFGCNAWYRVPDQLRRKLDERALPAVMMGYCDRQKAWRLWCLTHRHFITSDMVVFDEAKFDMSASIAQSRSDHDDSFRTIC